MSSITSLRYVRHSCQLQTSRSNIQRVNYLGTPMLFNSTTAVVTLCVWCGQSFTVTETLHSLSLHFTENFRHHFHRSLYISVTYIRKQALPFVARAYMIQWDVSLKITKATQLAARWVEQTSQLHKYQPFTFARNIIKKCRLTAEFSLIVSVLISLSLYRRRFHARREA